MLLQVKEAMRHNSIKTTMIYTRTIDSVSNGAERKAKAGLKSVIDNFMEGGN